MALQRRAVILEVNTKQSELMLIKIWPDTGSSAQKPFTNFGTQFLPI